MKLIIISLALFVVTINGQQKVGEDTPVDARIITGPIEDAIHGAAQSIRNMGLDPLEIKREAREIALPVPVLFNAAAYVEDVLSFGLSDIRINNLSYSVLLFRLSFDIELPLIHVSIGDSYGQVTVFGEQVEGTVSGSVDVNNIRVVGQVSVSIGIISGISIRNITIDFTLRSVDSRLTITFNSWNLSNFVNTFIGETIPNTLEEFKSDVNTLLEIIIREVVEANL